LPPEKSTPRFTIEGYGMEVKKGMDLVYPEAEKRAYNQGERDNKNPYI
jgi:hypothetical protein